MSKIEQIELAIENAIKRESKINEDSMNVPALASLRIRHLLNNLGAISARYLEVGVHKGGSFCSTVCQNKLESAVAIDSFESDEPYHTDQAMPQFIKNAETILVPGVRFSLWVGDSFSIELGKFNDGIDLYLYDAGHSREDQKNALLYYKPVLADEFIYCCDDWTYGEVKKGTLEGIEQGGYEILYARELINETEGDGHLNEEWWRGYGIFLLKKKP